MGEYIVRMCHFFVYGFFPTITYKLVNTCSSNKIRVLICSNISDFL